MFRRQASVLLSRMAFVQTVDGRDVKVYDALSDKTLTATLPADAADGAIATGTIIEIETVGRSKCRIVGDIPTAPKQAPAPKKAAAAAAAAAPQKTTAASSKPKPEAPAKAVPAPAKAVPVPAKAVPAPASPKAKTRAPTPEEVPAKASFMDEFVMTPELARIVDTAVAHASTDTPSATATVQHWDAAGGVGVLAAEDGSIVVVTAKDLVGDAAGVAAGDKVNYVPRDTLAAIGKASAASASAAGSDFTASSFPSLGKPGGDSQALPDGSRRIIARILRGTTERLVVVDADDKAYSVPSDCITGAQVTIGFFVKLDVLPDGTVERAHVLQHELLQSGVSATVRWYNGKIGSLMTDVGECRFNKVDVAGTHPVLPPNSKVVCSLARVPQLRVANALSHRAEYVALGVKLVAEAGEPEPVASGLKGYVAEIGQHEVTVKLEMELGAKDFSVPLCTLPDTQRMSIYSGVQVTADVALVDQVLIASNVAVAQTSAATALARGGKLRYTGTVVKAGRDEPSIVVASTAHGPATAYKNSVAELATVHVGARVTVIGDVAKNGNVAVHSVAPHKTLAHDRVALVRRVTAAAATTSTGEPDDRVALVAPLDGSAETTVRINRFDPDERVLVRPGALVKYDVCYAYDRPDTFEEAKASVEKLAPAKPVVLKSGLVGTLTADHGDFGTLHVPTNGCGKKAKHEHEVTVCLSTLDADVRWALRRGMEVTFDEVEVAGYPDRTEARNFVINDRA